MEGTPFGRYRLIDLLGRGGMGQVWRAYDTAIDRVVALKLLPTALANDEVFQERFRREAHAAAALDEPHVVPIYDFGEISGQLFVTMRQIRGRDLKEMLTEGPLPPERAIGIVEQIASALHAAHAVGLVHRDVKPSNIIVGEDDFAYLIDFGIARAVGQVGLTSDGAMVGTWAYMAPERISAGQSDTRADVYALACVLHESLTGERPFPGDSLEQQIRGHLTSAPPRPSEQQTGVPKSLDLVIATGMAKDPEGRYATTRELAQAARAALLSPSGRAPAWPRLDSTQAEHGVAAEIAAEIAAPAELSSVTRAVTFLLTDIEGSTAAWETDPGAMAAALARHDQLVDQIVSSRGGQLIKTRGERDATFSVFDRPSAAASAAIELQDAIGREPWKLSEPLRLRVALHTGEVEFRDGDYFGRAVNRAARLRALAAGGQILCSGAVAELVIDSLPDDVALADLGMRQLRNLARPEHVFELHLDTDDESVAPRVADVPMERPALAPVLSGAGPFVGRSRELDQLMLAWQTALGGVVRAVLIAGEPGVGKTRLAGEWSRLAYEQGAVVLYGRCDEDLAAPYQPFAEALRSLVPGMGAHRLRGLRGAEALLSLVPGLTDVVPDLPAPARADPDTERYALFDAVAAVLRVASKAAPVVLILDDLQWASKPTLLLLRHLLRFGEHARVQIVGTYRSTDLDRSHPLAAMLADLHRDGTADRLALSGLDEDDVTAYVAEVGYDDEELAHALASVTGGNPFFLIEALRHVDESGGVWDQSTLPQGVREAVSRRLSRLPVGTNKALAAAAVVGSRFALDLIESVVGGELIDAFDEACQAGIVIEEPGGFYRFNHAIVRQSLLAELASVRRMRLHQRIAATLESQPGAGDDLLAELAHHYFECAWAGNAAKAVSYCRRAADQAMARLAYEGAADLYDRALHALEDLDDELPDRDEQAAELLIARCEALLAAGDVASAAGAVAQLLEVTVGSARLSAWATCFDGQLSILIRPERLDQVEAELAAAARQLAGLRDAAGEAKAHTVRAVCLARLGRIGDCELALDNALTAARRVREHRRVNAVLAGAPLAALWGPNPVPRAGGRCVDVIRLVRITTDSPAVEATSTRCQAVLEALRGRDAAARRMIESARRTVTELGLRHARLEVEQFAGIVEQVAGDPVAAERYLRKAYNGFRRMGLDADTAETAALLGRTCLALGQDAEADELCTESERLAGHQLKASIAWRTLRAQLLSRGGDHDQARLVAEAAVGMAERTDGLVDHGDACLALATVMGAAGDGAAGRAVAERALGLYERKGAAALAERARAVIGGLLAPAAEPDNTHPRLTAERLRASRLENAAGRVTEDALNDPLAEGFPGASTVLATRGERLVLRHGRNPDEGHESAPTLNVFEIDADDRITAVVAFGAGHLDAAVAELDSRYVAGEAAACARVWTVVAQRLVAFNQSEIRTKTAKLVHSDHRLAVSGGPQGEPDTSPGEDPDVDLTYVVEQVHQLTDRGAVVTHVGIRTSDVGLPAEQRVITVLTVEGDLVSRCEVFDDGDPAAALARFEELCSTPLAGATFGQLPSRARQLENAASRVYEHYRRCFAAADWDAVTELLAETIVSDDRRRMIGAGVRRGRDAEIEDLRTIADIGANMTADVVATRGERLALTRTRYAGLGGPSNVFVVEVYGIIEIDSDERIVARLGFDLDDVDAAYVELDERYVDGEAAPYARVWRSATDFLAEANRHRQGPMLARLAYTDHRRISFAPGDFGRAVRELWSIVPDVRYRMTRVHALAAHGGVASLSVEGADAFGSELQWPRALFLEPDEPRLEVYEESDVDAALARFEELRPDADRPRNAASRMAERYFGILAARSWSAMAEVLSEDGVSDDRRRAPNSGLRRGREGVIAALRETRETLAAGGRSVLPEHIATRGRRLALSLLGRAADRPDPSGLEALCITEVDSTDAIVAVVLFEPDQIDAAFAELDARYRAGEASEQEDTWVVIAGVFAAVNRDEAAAISPDCVCVDHRQRDGSPAGEDPAASIRAALDVTPGVTVRIQDARRLSELGLVVVHSTVGGAPADSDPGGRTIAILAVERGLIGRCEFFDAADFDAALVRLDRLEAGE